jgi:hypothetical protein
MANTVVPPQIRPVAGKLHPVWKDVLPFLQLNPLFGVTLQDTTVQQSGWIQVGEGTMLSLQLSASVLTGTLDVVVETMHNPSDKSEQPRPLSAQFQQVTAAGGTSRLTAPCDEYVRVTATPGKGNGQSATWTITGKGYRG